MDIISSTDPLESRLFTLKSSHTEPSQLSENRSGPRRWSSENEIGARTRKKKYEWRSLESDVATIVVNTTWVSNVTPTSGVKNSGIIRGSVPVVRGMSRYESVWNKV
jgi:hypothetical protein